MYNGINNPYIIYHYTIYIYIYGINNLHGFDYFVLVGSQGHHECSSIYNSLHLKSYYTFWRLKLFLRFNFSENDVV